MRAFTASCVAPGAPSNEALLSRLASAPPLAPQRVLRLLWFSTAAGGEHLFFGLPVLVDFAIVQTNSTGWNGFAYSIGPNFCSTPLNLPFLDACSLKLLDGISFFLGNDELAQKKQPRPLAWRGESPRVIQPSDARVHAQQRTGCAPGQPRSKRADVARCVQGTCVWFIAGDGLPAPRHAAHARQQRQ